MARTLRLTLLTGAAAAVGCFRPAPPDANTVPELTVSPVAVAPTPADPGPDSRPRFESELVTAIGTASEIGGDTSRGTTRSVRYYDGKPFRVVDKDTVSRGKPDQPGYVRLEVEFVAHRNGRDVYRTRYTVNEGGATFTSTEEVGYTGEQTVLLREKRCMAVLRPPTEPPPAPGESPMPGNKGD